MLLLIYFSYPFFLHLNRIFLPVLSFWCAHFQYFSPALFVSRSASVGVLSTTLPISFRNSPPFTSNEPSFWQKWEKSQRGTPFPLLQLTAVSTWSPLLIPTWDYTRGLEYGENGGTNGYPLSLLASIIRKHHFITSVWQGFCVSAHAPVVCLNVGQARARIHILLWTAQKPERIALLCAQSEIREW